jgi:hypothetical protein
MLNENILVKDKVRSLSGSPRGVAAISNGGGCVTRRWKLQDPVAIRLNIIATSLVTLLAPKWKQTSS